MTWSYSGDPSSSDRDAVRFLCGDTDTTNQLLTDEEIDWILTEESNVYLAAAQACGSIASTFASKADKSVGDLRISYESIQKQYADRSAKLQSRGAVRSAMPYAGGISKNDKETVEEDTDRVVPAFERDIHDNPSVQYDARLDSTDEI